MSPSISKSILILAVCASLAVATPVPQNADTSEVPMSSNKTTEFTTLNSNTPIGAQCYLMGNPTLYPLGLRVGVYLQWFATIFANFFVPSVARNMRGLNTLFQLAVFSGLCYAITNIPTLDGLEAFILLTLCIGSISALITSPNMNIRVTRLGSISRLAIFLAVFIFGAWYWFIAVNDVEKSTCTEQIQFLFFWKIHLYHWFQQFSQAVMVISAIAVTAALGWEVFNFLVAFRNKGTKGTVIGIFEGSLCKDSFLGGVLQQEKYAWVSGALLVIVVVTMAAFIVTIESALTHSSAYFVFSLGSPVELVPFVVGIFSMANVTVGMAMGTMKVVNSSRSMTPEDKEMGSRPSTREI